MIAELLSRLCERLAVILDRGLSEEARARIIETANKQLLKEEGEG